MPQERNQRYNLILNKVDQLRDDRKQLLLPLAEEVRRCAGANTDGQSMVSKVFAGGCACCVCACCSVCVRVSMRVCMCMCEKTKKKKRKEREGVRGWGGWEGRGWGRKREESACKGCSASSTEAEATQNSERVPRQRARIHPHLSAGVAASGEP